MIKAIVACLPLPNFYPWFFDLDDGLHCAREWRCFLVVAGDGSSDVRCLSHHHPELFTVEDMGNFVGFLEYSEQSQLNPVDVQTFRWAYGAKHNNRGTEDPKADEWFKNWKKPGTLEPSAESSD